MESTTELHPHLDFATICKAIDDDFNPPGYESSDYDHCCEASTANEESVLQDHHEPVMEYEPPPVQTLTDIVTTTDNDNDASTDSERRLNFVSGETLLTVSSCGDEEDDNDLHKESYIMKESKVTRNHYHKRLFCLTLSSNVWFLIGSIFYMWLAVLDFRYMKNIQGIPDWVLVADDDYSWADYWFEDDYVFETPKGAWVSQSQIVYAVAATSFVFVGLIDFCARPGLLAVVFILAGTFGLLSACYQEANVYLSSVLNAVSVHLYLLEAAGLLFRRQTLVGSKWIRVGDVFFVIATGIEVGLSFTYVFETYNVRLSKLSISASALWLTVSLIYLTATICGKKYGAFDIPAPVHEDNDHAKSAMDTTEKGVMGDFGMTDERELEDDELSFDSVK